MNKKIFTDEYGRHYIPNGFVTITSDEIGDIHNTEDDFQRMAKSGANAQVVRIHFGKIGALPGVQADPEYFKELDRLVELGKLAGIMTMFKLTVYDSEFKTHFSRDNWRDLYLNKNNWHELLVDGWANLFERYKNEPAVFGYDLINEPFAYYEPELIWEYEPEFADQKTFMREYFVPLYQKIIDRLQEISADKWALVQPYHVPPAVHRRNSFPCLPLDVPINKGGFVFAPHYYGDDALQMIRNYMRDARVQDNALVIFGEYGKPIFTETDQDQQVQDEYVRILQETVNQFDRHAIGAVKAWWCGSRVFHKRLLTEPKARTWAFFTDDSPTGKTERKYIADIVIRPRPLVIAGIVHRFEFNFFTRIFTMEFIPDSSKGDSIVFVPERHYPNGFLFEFNGNKWGYDLESDNLKLVVTPYTNLDTCAALHYNKDRNRLIITDWNAAKEENYLRITF